MAASVSVLRKYRPARMQAVLCTGGGSSAIRGGDLSSDPFLPLPCAKRKKTVKRLKLAPNKPKRTRVIM